MEGSNRQAVTPKSLPVGGDAVNGHKLVISLSFLAVKKEKLYHKKYIIHILVLYFQAS
jgi:hypothetical protein